PDIHTLSLHDALPICPQRGRGRGAAYLAVAAAKDDVEASRGIAVSGDVRHLAIASTGRLGLVLLVGRNRVELACTSTAAALVERSEEHTSELQSLAYL